MQLGLEGKVVLVTGGTKSIGLCIVKSFLQEGAIVHFCSRTASEATSTQESLSSIYGAGKVQGHTVDVGNAEQVSQWVKESATLSGRIDVVVSNVSALSVANTRQSWDATYQTDMMGTYTLIDTALPYLKESKGNVVAISTVSGRYVDFTAPSPYGAIKAALIHYISQLAHTLAPHGVRANSVSPGNIYVADGFWGQAEKDMPELFQKQLEANPMGRMGKPEEVADSVVWLASKKAGFVSGTNLLVDGAVSPGVQF
ncbi:17-beta-hydroxysteroid dehydrogenase 14 [Cytospora mali]|uniref:17-beta-hydroxysteroid dehydrogenase 14 n=1 Tax=Cytospora mali TaxID=578113 RepID=A0A194V0Q2_CYTMA|nr:17-beta-hydroxysteroid dehydrogenase 14 [Valsa mali var. pyri (nom. inval.)]